MKTWKQIKNEARFSPEDIEDIKRLREEAEAEQLAFSIADLRKALKVTQVQLAERTGKSQGGISQIENANDHYLSTIKQMVEALGAELEVNAVIDGERLPLS